MKHNERKLSKSPIIPFAEIPFEGLDFELSEKFADLYRSNENPDQELIAAFDHPIEVRGSATPVGSKVDLRGKFMTAVTAPCDRCTVPVSQKVEGNLDTFLMATTQFSQHDKPGGKVIHGPTRGLKPSRHHSRSKAPVLSDAEGEHDDENFGAFDGHTVDLRPLVRELLILQLPMKTLCSESCKGLCLTCGGNVNDGKCSCPKGPQLVVEEDASPESDSPLAAALKKRKTF
jgi:uncharacterized metal-binding protein YceD (DUF177 family)